MTKIELDDVKEKVADFIKKEFPEISADAKSSGAADEIANVIFEMLTGDEDNAFAGG